MRQHSFGAAGTQPRHKVFGGCCCFELIDRYIAKSQPWPYVHPFPKFFWRSFVIFSHISVVICKYFWEIVTVQESHNSVINCTSFLWAIDRFQSRDHFTNWPPCWCKTYGVSLEKMVLCAIFGCGTRTVRDKGIYMARIPSVITNQGEELRNLSEERWNKWTSAISGKGLTDGSLDHGRVCGRHFISGKAAKLPKTVW